MPNSAYLRKRFRTGQAASHLWIICSSGTSEARCGSCTFSNPQIVHVVILSYNFCMFDNSQVFFHKLLRLMQIGLFGANGVLLSNVQAGVWALSSCGWSQVMQLISKGRIPCIDALFFPALYVKILSAVNRSILLSSTGQWIKHFWAEMDMAWSS